MKFRHLFRLDESAPSYRIYKADGVTMRLDFFENILRIAMLRDGTDLIPTWSICPGEYRMPLEGRSKLSAEGFRTVEPEVVSDGEHTEFEFSGIRFSVEHMNFRITARNTRGILYADRSGLAYNFDGELGDGSVHFTMREEDEEIFGLGDKCGSVNKSKRSFELGTDDAMGFSAESSDPLYKYLPFYICRNSAGSYGIYYDTYSNGRVNFGEEHDNYFEPFSSIRFEEENMVFYLIMGTPMEIVSRFTEMCGGAAPVPDWAFRYCGSTMTYTDAPDADTQLRGFVEKCRKYGIQPGGFYLSSGYTQIGDKRCVFHWNREKIPSPKGLSDYFRENGMEIMPNVKPAFLTDNPLYDEIAENGWFLYLDDGSPALFPFWGGMASYLDFTNPGAYGFWKKCVEENLVDYGYRNIWNDNNEYDVWDRGVYAYGFGKKISARLIRPLFSYLMSRASREACIERDGSRDAEPFMISRCAIAGTQRVATTWTGDNRTDWRDLRFNHYQAMTMSLSGFIYFGQDIGGFSGPSPDRELFLRWIQYGIFTPRFVLHSWKPDSEPTMPWLYPELRETVKRLFNLRDSFIPYLSAQMQKCIYETRPLIYPVFLKCPGYDPDSDAFFFGDDILACPVFDRDAREVTVLLPENAENWVLRGSKGKYKGGTTVTVPCAPEDDPVWFLRN
ncbi:MAG: hypothetical protein IKE18_07605 [Oscillospiraceae bacterium]|nr:hypothetical protein [Oscillospiraceae bacterium]